MNRMPTFNLERRISERAGVAGCPPPDCRKEIAVGTVCPLMRVLIAVAVAWCCGKPANVAAATANPVEDRPRLCLNGTWDFHMDPEQEGEAKEWWSPDAQYPNTISVPGIWQAQEFGEPSGITRHDYQGVAWFRRSFTISKEWSGKRIWLRFEGICNHGDVYLNGQKVGLVETFITPYEFDVTDWVAFDQPNVLACRVDSRGPNVTIPTAKTLPFAALSQAYQGSYLGMMQFLVQAGGITSHVFVEARPDPRIDEVVLTPDLTSKMIQANLRCVRQRSEREWQGRVTIHIAPTNADETGVTATTAIRFAANMAESDTANVRVSLPNLRPWSPDDPFLYSVSVALLEGEEIADRHTIRTGFREFKATSEGNFLLNGHPFYLRGIGYDSLEPITGVPAPDRKVYAERLRMLKQYGFNYVRFLAHCPHREFFEAADEEGLFLQPEGESFNNGPPMAPAAGELLTRQVPRIIREFRNHPSWYAFSCVNEAFGGEADPVKQAYFQTAFKTFRETDPTRFFIASEGGGDHWPTDIITDRTAAMHKVDAPDHGTPPKQVFDGVLDEVAVYGRAISAEAMQKLAGRTLDSVAYRSAVMELQPIAYWQLEESEPGVVRDSGDQGHDGQHASMAVPIGIGKPGVVGRALELGSSSGDVHGVSLTAQADSIVPQMQKSFSLSLWVNPKSITANDFGTFFSCGAAEPGRALILGLDGQHGHGRVLVGQYMNDILRSTRTLRAGEWNHVGLTWDGKRLCLFVNGEPDADVNAVFACAARDLAIGGLVQLTTRTPADYRSRPHVWHEFNNMYLAPLPDLDIEKRLTGAITQACVLEPHRRRLDAYGVLSRYPEIRELSIRLYRNYVKYVFEQARRMPRLDGYAWWVAGDIPGGVETDVTSYGVLDMLYQPEKFTFDDFRQFNRESVLMVDADIDQRVLQNAESRSLNISLSHYGPNPVQHGCLRWKIITGSGTLKEGVIQPVNAQSAAITSLGSIPLGPFESHEPLQVQVGVELISDACHQTNSWTFWAFPEKKRELPQTEIANLTGAASLDNRYGVSGPLPLDKAKLALVSRLTPEILSYLESGGRAIMLQDTASSAAPGGGFLKNPGVLAYRALWLRCNGHVVENHPALTTFPHDGFSDYQLMRLYGNDVLTVDYTPAASLARTKVNPIIWSLDLGPWKEDASQFDFALRRGAMLSECRIGKGRALLCTLYVLDGVNRGLPEAGYLLDCLVDYASSERFAPSTPPFTADEARQFFKSE